MDKAEKKKADALRIQLDERSRLLTQQQAEKTDIYKVLTEAAKNGADSLTLDKIKASKTPDEAITAAGSYGIIKPKPEKASAGGGIRLTDTQLNSGAVKSGMSFDNFKTLPPDVQNYFVNTSAKSIGAINSLLTEVQNGTKSATDVQTLIDSSNISAPVKEYWKTRLATIAPTQTQGGFLSNIWGGIKSLVGL